MATELATEFSKHAADAIQWSDGAKRLRDAQRAGLESVPVVIASAAHDVYAQVAGNQKRHGLAAWACRSSTL